MSIDKAFDFLFVQYDSFEEFREKIGRKDIAEQVVHLLENLNYILSEDDNQTKIQELRIHSTHSYFFPNLLFLYRWLLSFGYRQFSEEQIGILFRFLNLARVPDHVVRQYTWSLVFLVKEGRRTDEQFWEQTILPHIDKLSGLEHSLSGLISLWLLYHCGLKQLFLWEQGQNEGTYKISELKEELLIRYINLVNVCPELEEVFGVAIERDMYRIYKGLSRGNHE